MTKISVSAYALIEEFWPGPLTLIFNASQKVSKTLLASGNTIGIRIPACAICLDLLKQNKEAMVSTSANMSGKQDLQTAEQVIKELGSKIDLIIDVGSTPASIPSTVIDTTVEPPKLIRTGSISEDKIKTILTKIKNDEETF